MRLARGPRPPAIRAFATLSLVAAAIGVYANVIDVGFLHGDGSWHIPADEARRVQGVSTVCARLLIALVPATFIWFFASTIARWMVAIFAALRAWQMVGDVRDSISTPTFWLNPYAVSAVLLAVAAAGLLFKPTARDWFARDRSDKGAVFD